MLTFEAVVEAANDSIATPLAINPYSVQIPYGVTASLSEAQLGDIKVFPNPAHDHLHIDLSGVKDVQSISILDLTGREVYNHSITKLDGLIDIDVNGFAKGVYCCL